MCIILQKSLLSQNVEKGYKDIRTCNILLVALKALETARLAIAMKVYKGNKEEALLDLPIVETENISVSNVALKMA